MRPLTLLAFCLIARGGGAEDCNGNGSADTEEVSRGASADCNANGIPDECDVAVRSFGFATDWFAEIGSTADVASGDLNGDGQPDAAATLSSSREIAVLLGEDGAFPITSYFPVSLPPASIRLVDLDGDGDVDAAVATPDGVSVLWNDGVGGLTTEVALLIGQGTPVVHAADIDRDGDTDLLTLNRNPDGGLSNISVLSNDGSGRFAAARHHAAGDGPLALALADLDGDGDPDAAVVDSGPNIRILENDGAGRFPRMTTVGLRFSPTDITAGAFDRDGNVDLCLSRPQAVAVLLNRGEGAFAELPPVSTPAEFFAMRGMLTADLDENGSLDVALLGPGTVLMNDGAGAFEAHGVAGPLGSSGAAVDLDRDGDMDIVTARGNGVGFHFHRPVALSADGNSNGVPDECEADCNSNWVPDDYDLASGAEEDCNGNTIPDTCDLDCDRNGVPDDCDIATGTTTDCNHNLVPDPCEPPAADCNANGTPDDCEIASGASADCNANGVPDECDVEPSYGFRGVATSDPTEAGVIGVSDVDGDGTLDLLARAPDAIVLFRDLSHRGLRFTTVIGPGRGPVATGDIDGDGDIDICMDPGGRRGNSSRTQLAVLLQENEGAFERRAVVTLPFRASSLVVADFDADRIQDLCLSSRGGLRLLRGLGGGLFGQPEPASERFGSVTAADLDRDGSLDLIVDEITNETVKVLINSGQGRFTEAASLTTGAGGIVARDFDGDGDIDLASGGGYLYGNDGRAGFSLRESFGDRWRRYYKEGKAVDGGDVDGDGDLDLLLLREGALWTYRNDGARGFWPLDELDLPNWPRAFHSEDIDRDGLVDLIGDGVWLARNLGDPMSYGRRVEHYRERSGVSDAVCALDLDRDGDRDLVVSRSTGTAALHENKGAGSFAPPMTIALGVNAGPIAASDLDDDGDEDMALGDADSARVLILWNDGLLTPRAGDALDVAGNATLLVAADLDGDGRADLASASRYEIADVTLLFGEGSGGFASLRVPVVRPPVFISPFDADGDGDIDLALGYGVPFDDPGGVSFLLNEGGRLFMAGGDIALSGRPTAGDAGDFDGDGKMDLAMGVVTEESCFIDTCDSTGGISLLMNGGQGRFREVFVATWVPGDIAASDLDGDGDLDLHFSSGSILAYLNDGQGGMERAASIHMDRVSYGRTAADLDGDGLPDLVTVSDRSLTIAYARFAGASPDQNLDGVPDECESPPFRRGDSDADGAVGLTDAVALLDHLFRGGAAPSCEKASDANDDGRVNIADPVSLLNGLFLGGPAPLAPGASCGLDPTPDTLSCEAYVPCA